MGELIALESRRIGRKSRRQLQELNKMYSAKQFLLKPHPRRAGATASKSVTAGNNAHPQKSAEADAEDLAAAEAAEAQAKALLKSEDQSRKRGEKGKEKKKRE